MFYLYLWKLNLKSSTIKTKGNRLTWPNQALVFETVPAGQFQWSVLLSWSFVVFYWKCAQQHLCVVRFKNIKVHKESNNTREKTNCINEIKEKEPYGTKHRPNNVTNIYHDWKNFIITNYYFTGKRLMNILWRLMRLEKRKKRFDCDSYF